MFRKTPPAVLPAVQRKEKYFLTIVGSTTGLKLFPITFITIMRTVHGGG